MKKKILLGLGLSATFCMLFAQDKIDTTRDTLEQWVETQQIISETKSDWALEKSILQDSEKLLSSELERLNQALEDLDATATTADEERTKLAAEKELLATASAVVESNVGALETQVKAIVKTFPEPLVDKIKPLIRRLPKDPKNTKSTLGERVQNIVGILSQADKFNGTITQTSESREVDGGRVVEVRTIYWGLGGAFYIDAAGEYAGVGHPGADGWEWPKIDGAGPQIKRLLDVYEGSEDIQFVEVPASIK
ncbi:MAG: DUF3450 family protein [Lentimonas sp.]